MSFGDYTFKNNSFDTNVSSRKNASNPVTKSSEEALFDKDGKELKGKAKVKALKKLEIEELKAEKAKIKKEHNEILKQQQEDQQRAYEDQFIYNEQVNQFNLAFISTTKDYKSGSRYNEVKGSFDSSSVNFNKNKDAISFESLKSQGLEYSSTLGEALARDIAGNSVGFTGKCSKSVREGLQRTGMYNGHTGSAYEMGAVLGQNDKFQEVSAQDIDLKQLPSGCVLVYDQGAAGYNSEHGHIEVTLGDGTACSDGRTYNLRSSDNMRIFVPIQQVA